MREMQIAECRMQNEELVDEACERDRYEDDFPATCFCPYCSRQVNVRTNVPASDPYLELHESGGGTFCEGSCLSVAFIDDLLVDAVRDLFSEQRAVAS